MTTIALPHELIYAGELILVNAHYPYRKSPRGQRLVPVHNGMDVVLLAHNAAKPLELLMAQLGNWEQIAAVSGWRSRREQQQIYDDSLRDNGKEFTENFVALPGCSEHQTGLAIDLALRRNEIDFIRPDFPYTGICQTFRQKAPYYGFVERYPKAKANITGIAHEPWHFRYVGKPHAEVMTEHGLVLEEYISFLKNHQYGIAPYVYQGRSGLAEIAYLPAAAQDTILTTNANHSYSISGNNVDGFIITAWRTRHDRK